MIDLPASGRGCFLGVDFWEARPRVGGRPHRRCARRRSAPPTPGGRRTQSSCSVDLASSKRAPGPRFGLELQTEAAAARAGTILVDRLHERGSGRRGRPRFEPPTSPFFTFGRVAERIWASASTQGVRHAAWNPNPTSTHAAVSVRELPGVKPPPQDVGSWRTPPRACRRDLREDLETPARLSPP